MRSSAVRVERDAPHPVFDPSNVSAFADELAELCRKHGLGITGNPTVFVMEPVDYQLRYYVDEQSNLKLH